MEQKTKVLVAVLLVILGAGLAIALVTGNKTNQNVPPAITEQQGFNQEAPVLEVQEKRLGDTISEGVIISVGEKEIAISNNTPNPDLFLISTSVPVVELSKDGKETELGLSALKSGRKARVLYEETESSKKKTATKITLLED